MILQFPSKTVRSVPSSSRSSEGEHKFTRIHEVRPSSQVLSLIEADQEYRSRYERCQAEVGYFPSVLQLIAEGQGGNGYKQEYTSHRGMIRRASKLYKQPWDEELRDFLIFLLHVGPKPQYRPSNPLSLDRINTWKGYEFNNLRWADKQQQGSNRRTTQHHLVRGTRLTHAELAAELSTRSGEQISTETVKKRHQRRWTIEQQFRAAGVPYDSGLSPRRDWDFPANAPRIAARYNTDRRRGETRVDFYARTLLEKILSLKDKTMSPHFTSPLQKQRAAKLLGMYELELKRVKSEIEEFDYFEFEEDLEPILLVEPVAPKKIEVPSPPPPVKPKPQATKIYPFDHQNHQMYPEGESGDFSVGLWQETTKELEDSFRRLQRGDGLAPPTLSLPDFVAFFESQLPDMRAALIEIMKQFLNKLIIFRTGTREDYKKVRDWLDSRFSSSPSEAPSPEIMQLIAVRSSG